MAPVSYPEGTGGKTCSGFCWEKKKKKKKPNTEEASLHAADGRRIQGGKKSKGRGGGEKKKGHAHHLPHVLIKLLTRGTEGKEKGRGREAAV